MSIPPQPIIVPPALRACDTIALLSPSSRLNEVFPLRIQRARAFLESQGYRVVEIYSPLPSGREASIAHRVAEIQ
jgi:muramoyltetrapeptide carboxypeptidase LdcA involved in peptidoglycan recycling